MFDPSAMPRLYAVPLGLDFSCNLYHGLVERFAGMAPEDVAQVEVFVNTRRMQRRLISLFHEGPAMLLPQIKLVTDIGVSAALSDIPPAVPSLKRRLEIAQLVKALISVDPTLAAKDSVFDLADSLFALMSEMQGEGVLPEKIANLDVSDQSGHWQRALQFVGLVQDFFNDKNAPDAEGRQRRVIEAEIACWQSDPPQHPVIVAGSTGSRGATSLFMQAVARLPKGAVVIPGFDRDMHAGVWASLDAKDGLEDHPQFRFKALCDALNIEPDTLPDWHATPVPNPDRNALISLSLRPAPVTDQWITEGAHLSDLEQSTQGITLIEASSPRAEADAIAARLRHALDEGKTAALITPDRILTRQVAGALDRWGIKPDDSAGLPLQLSAPGRLLRHMADHMCEQLDAEHLLVLLRHPLTNSENEDRGPHILRTNALELELRRNGPPFPTAESLRAWAATTAKAHPDRAQWIEWVIATLLEPNLGGTRALTDHLAQHIEVTERLAAGPGGDDSGGLWKEAAGREALRVISDLRLHSEAGGKVSAEDYRRILSSLLSSGEVRDRDSGDPRVLIWGTLEARVQSADLVILGSMNEGTWPEAATPDPWLNRQMRKEAGLLLPERRIGLSAHDYQQAVCSKDVVISRAIRSDEAETVPSRWVNRLMNLLGGLTDKGGPDRLSDMRARGAYWIDVAAKISAPPNPVAPAVRPSPCPPKDVRPTSLSVTQIKTLIRDPYAIYAKKILRLNALDLLTKTADAPLYGIIVHEVLERFTQSHQDPDDPKALAALLAIADTVLNEMCPWPAMRHFWKERIAGFAPHFLEEETARRHDVTNIHVESWGELYLPSIAFTLTGKADRIDVIDDGRVRIYDYKTGAPPSRDEQLNFDKQLLLEAAMVEEGAFKSVGSARTADAVYIRLGGDLKNRAAPLDASPPDETLQRFQGLIAKWMDPNKGYTSRRANQSMKFEGDYDHLARHGEWDETELPTPEDMA